MLSFKKPAHEAIKDDPYKKSRWGSFWGVWIKEIGRFLTSSREEKIRLSLDQFEALVNQALKEIPQEFLEKLENLDIVVEEEPSPELLKELGLRERDLLFGLYQGVPRPGKSYFHGVIFPDRITLFRTPILRSCRSEEHVRDQIKKTLVHEIAHHFGFSETKIRRLGY